MNSQIDRDVLTTNPTDSITATSPNISAPVLSTKKFSDRSGTATTTNHQQLFSPQNTANNNSYTSTPATSLGTSQRRTTSLLNIFSSNSQGMILC